VKNKNEKCISCEFGGRGKSASTKGAALRAKGPGFLSKCECPIDTALTEFWMVKVTGNNPAVPKRDGPHPLSDFALNPVSLRMIGEAIYEASGLNTDSMFQPAHLRRTHTIQWCFDQMIQDEDDGTRKRKL